MNPAIRPMPPREGAPTRSDQAVEQFVATLRARIREELEPEIQAAIEARVAAALPTVATIGFRAYALDSDGDPLPFGKLFGALEAVWEALDLAELPSLGDEWNAWVNGAWFAGSRSVVAAITKVLEHVGGDDIELFEGYPQDFFTRAVPNQ